MTKIKLNGAKVQHTAQLHDDTKQLLTQQAQDHDFLNDSPSVQKAIDSLLSAELPQASNSHAIAPSAKAVRQVATPRRIYASSISNTLTHAGQFIAAATSYGPGYNTNIPIYEVSSLQQIRDTAYGLVTAVDTAETTYNYAVAFRMQEFADLSALSALVTSEMTMNGTTKETINQVRFLTRKLRGQRKVAKDPNDPFANYNSASQMNYDNRAANFERLIMMAAADPNYDPVVGELKVSSLQIKLDALNTANNDVIVAKANLDAARMARNTHFNAPDTGLVAVFINAKNVVLTNFGRTSEEYKRVSGLAFKRIQA